MTLYRLQMRWRTVPVLKVVEAERMTGKSVWIDGKRHSRESHFGGAYYETLEAAHAAAIEYGEQQVLHARNQLQRANDFLGAAKGLVKSLAKAAE